MPETIYNPNPTVFLPSKTSVRKVTAAKSLWLDANQSQPLPEEEGNVAEPIDETEIWDLIRTICDPEHPNTLEELRVVSAQQVKVKGNIVTVEFTPTVPQCGSTNLIGLCLHTRLLRSLPSRFKVDLFVKPGSHYSEHAINRQLNDKERVLAALENQAILKAVEGCLEPPQR